MESKINHREQTGGCQGQVVKEGEMGKGGQRTQSSSYQMISSGDLMYIMVTIINNTVLYT